MKNQLNNNLFDGVLKVTDFNNKTQLSDTFIYIFPRLFSNQSPQVTRGFFLFKNQLFRFTHEIRAAYCSFAADCQPHSSRRNLFDIDG